MKSYLVFSLLSIFLIRISVATSEAAIDDNWANDDIFSNTYSDLDSASTPDAGLQGSMWDENLITDADSFAGTLADADTGCSQNIGPSGKRRRNNFCASPGSPADLRLSLPQSPFETLESKNGINFNLDTIRFPGGTPQMTQMDNIYCGNQNFVVCDSGRVNDKSSNGNGKYRLQNVKRGMVDSLFAHPSILLRKVTLSLLISRRSSSGISMRQPLFNLVL